jgi:hypothetical protein
MFPERQNGPISKMLVQRNENSAIRYGATDDLKIVGTVLTHFG